MQKEESSDVPSKGDIQLKVREPALQGGGGISSESSASCIFKVAVKYLTLSNVAHKQDTDSLVMMVVFFRTSPFDAAGYLLFEAAGILAYGGS